MENTIVTREKAIELLKNGGVGVMPTDTVYGLVARAEDPEAVARMYALKRTGPQTWYGYRCIHRSANRTRRTRRSH